MLLDCSPAWVTQPPATWSTPPGSMPARSSSPVCARPRISAACRPASAPPRLPIGVRTASMMTAVPTAAPPSGSRRTHSRTRSDSGASGRSRARAVVVESTRPRYRREAATAEPSIPPGFDFTDPDLYANRVPADELAELRRTAPVWWNAQPRGASGFDDKGYWVVTRHADVLETSKASGLFSSEAKTAIIRHGQPVTEESLMLQRLIMLNIDPPQHTALRGIVSRGFTPRAIRNLREALTVRAERIVQTALAEGTGDFVADVACELPLQAIAELLGIPQEDRGKIFHWSNQMIGYDDPEFEGDSTVAAAELVGYCMVMAEDRKQCPREDILTEIVSSNVAVIS